MDQVQKERLARLACSTTSKPTLCTIRCNDALLKRVQWQRKPIANELLFWVLSIKRHVLLWRGLPFGTSLIAIARRAER